MQVKCTVRPVGEQSSAPVRLCLLLVVLENHSAGCQPVCSCLVISRQCEAAGSLSGLAREPPEETGYFSHLWSFLHSQGNCFGKLTHDPKSWGMLKILATEKKKACVSIHCLFWKDSVQNTEKTWVIPIDLAGFEWNPKGLVLKSSEAWASETGEKFLDNRLLFPQLSMSNCLFAPSILLLFLCILHGLGRWESDHSLLDPCRLICSFPAPLPHWEIPRLRFNHSPGKPSWETWYWFLAGPFSDTLFQAHPVSIATLCNNWDALHYFFHSSGPWV